MVLCQVVLLASSTRSLILYLQELIRRVLLFVELVVLRVVVVLLAVGHSELLAAWVREEAKLWQFLILAHTLPVLLSLLHLLMLLQVLLHLLLVGRLVAASTHALSCIVLQLVCLGAVLTRCSQLGPKHAQTMCLLLVFRLGVLTLDRIGLLRLELLVLLVGLLELTVDVLGFSGLAGTFGGTSMQLFLLVCSMVVCLAMRLHGAKLTLARLLVPLITMGVLGVMSRLGQGCLVIFLGVCILKLLLLLLMEVLFLQLAYLLLLLQLVLVGHVAASVGVVAAPRLLLSSLVSLVMLALVLLLEQELLTQLLLLSHSRSAIEIACVLSTFVGVQPAHLQTLLHHWHHAWLV